MYLNIDFTHRRQGDEMS